MQELVVESLVVSLAMVVFYVLVDETTQMPLAERDHACETLLFDRPDEPLGIGVEIGTLRRQPNRLNTGALQDLAKDPRIEGIAVVNQMARPAQTAIDRVGQIAGLLLHPRAARLRVDPGDGHVAGSQLDHEEDEVPPEPRQRQHLDGEPQAARPSQCACRNVFQGMCRLRSGAGSTPWSCRIRFTVVRAIVWPRFESAPRIRV